MSGGGLNGHCEDRFGPMMLVRRESTRGFGRREARIFPVMERIRRIAAFCGFRSDIALSKLFHRRFGMSLLAWRKLNCAV